MTRAKSKSKTRRGGPKSQSRRGDRGGPRYKAIGWVGCHRAGCKSAFRNNRLYADRGSAECICCCGLAHRVYIRLPAKRGRGKG